MAAKALDGACEAFQDPAMLLRSHRGDMKVQRASSRAPSVFLISLRRMVTVRPCPLAHGRGSARGSYRAANSGEKSQKGKLTVLKMQSPDEAVMYFPGEGKTSMGCKEALQITVNIWSYKYEWFWKEKRNVVYGRFRSSEKHSIPPLPKHPGEGV